MPIVFLFTLTFYATVPPQVHRLEVPDLKTCLALADQVAQMRTPLEGEVGFVIGCDAHKEQTS